MFLLAANFRVDLLEVNLAVFRMRINVPNVDDPSLVVHAHDQAVLIVANVEDNKLFTNGIGTSVCIADVLWA
jgi:hypothetical protein